MLVNIITIFIIILHIVCSYNHFKPFRKSLSSSSSLLLLSSTSSIPKIIDKISKVSNNTNIFRCKFEKKIKHLTRVSRVDSQEKWIKEIEVINHKLRSSSSSSSSSSSNSSSNSSSYSSSNSSSNSSSSSSSDDGINKIIELSKELLYSNIPEQVIEIYAAYYDMILSNSNDNINTTTNNNNNNNNTSDTINFPVIQNPNLILIVTRAFIALDDLKNALKLLQATSRYGVEFDINSKSLLLNELAKNKSPQGFRAALQLMKSMKSRNENIQSIGVLGLLEGISKLLLDHSKNDNKKTYNGQNILLVSSNQNLDNDDVWDTTIKISPQSAYNLAMDIVDDYLDLKTDEKAMNRKIIEEFLRISFRTGALLTKAELDKNYEINVYDERVMKTSNGIILTLETMARYNQTTWNMNIANMFIDECLRIGDVEGIELIVEQMLSRNLFAGTSTFNKLLQRYVANGDSEAAYECFNTVMMNNNTSPDSESIDLLLESCIQSKKGRYLAEQFLQKFSKHYDLGLLSKASLETIVQLKIMNNESYGGIMEIMINSGKQPDDVTISNAMKAFSKNGNIAGALHLYKLQSQAEDRRRVFRYQRAMSPSLQTDNEESKFSSNLPPPSKRTVHVLLEILRDNKMYEKSIEILNDVCKRATYAKLFSGSSPEQSKKSMDELDVKPMSVALTPSGEFVLSMQYEPDQTTYALVIESCIEASKADLAMDVYNLMETWGLKPDRRVYAALISAFGLRNDIPSCLGVFQEMRSRFTPDVANLQSIIDVCLTNNPFDIRSLSIVIDKMAEDGLDLDGFPDALTLGEALEKMTQQELPAGYEKRFASLTTIGVFVQAVRTGSTVDDLKSALNYIGTLGIHPDEETMEYFRLPDDNTPHTRNQLIPKRAKLRSLLDIDMPEGFEVEISSPARSPPKQGEPFFEFQQDRYKKHSIALQKSIRGESREDLVNDLDDDNAFYEDKDKSRFNDGDEDVDELVGDEIIAKKKTIVKKTVLPGITSIKRQDKRNSNQREILKRLSDAYNRK